MFRKLNFQPQVDEYNPQDIPSCNVNQIINYIGYDLMSNMTQLQYQIIKYLKL
jgi:hypothetical protein